MAYQSLSDLINRLRDGQEEAFEAVFSKYFNRLVSLATRKMSGLNLVPRSGEDIALSAMKSFCLGLRENRIDLDNEKDIWGFLFLITVRKACGERRKILSKKRGFGQTVIAENFAATDDESGRIESVITDDSVPELALELAELADELVDFVASKPIYREIIQMRMENYSIEEIAKKLDVVPHTVYYHLNMVKKRWELLKNLDILIDMKFDGRPNGQIAEWLEVKLDWVEHFCETLQTLWQKNPDTDKNSLDAVALFFSAPKAPQAHGGTRSDSDTEILTETAQKTARAWHRLIRKQWLSTLVRALNQYEKQQERDPHDA